MDIITSSKWWDVVRYKRIGTIIAQKLQNSALRKELRQLFNECKNKMSYFDFFKFIEEKLNIKLKNWEEDSLEERLDRLGMAFIEFNEFNEFTREFGCDWGEEVLENDLED